MSENMSVAKSVVAYL